MKAWHFTDGNKLRDGRPLPRDGELLKHAGDVEICESGLHASKRLIDALGYAPGSTICRVECGDIVESHNDKFVCRERTILWRIDGEDVLRHFARKCALDEAHLWDMPDIVKQYLLTGDESIREAAYRAASNAAYSAAYWAAYWTASSAASNAASSAASNAAYSAASNAASSAASNAAYSAAYNAAYRAASNAAYRAASGAASNAASSAASGAAYRAARTKQDKRLVSMVIAEHKRVNGS